MEERTVIEQLDIQFALRIIKLYQYLANEKKEFVMLKQGLK